MTKKLSLENCLDFLAQELFNPKIPKGEALKKDLIGVELEAFPIRFLDFEKTKATPVPLIGDKFSLQKALDKASVTEGGKIDLHENKNPSPIRFPNGSSFQYEPGGQIEIATRPCKSLPELVNQLQLQQDLLDQITKENEVDFAQIGTNPWFDSAQIGLQLDKPRYRALQKYFDSISPSGIKMMRQTCSLHVNLDLGSTEITQVRRIMAANLLSPFATAIFANSGILEQKKTTRKSHRSYLWQQLDPKRSGIQIPKSMSDLPSKAELIDCYLDFVINAPIIHIKTLGDRVFPEKFTFEYWLKNPIEGISPSLSDLENHLSLLYPEVRPKGFLEIRTADALPRKWQLVPAIFYVGILYSERSLEKSLELLLPFRKEIDSLWRQASLGFESDQLSNLSKKLMELAMDGLAGLSEEFVGIESQNNLIGFYEKFTLSGMTMADVNILRFSEGKSLIY